MTWPMSPNHAAIWAILLPHYRQLIAGSLPSTFVDPKDVGSLIRSRPKTAVRSAMTDRPKTWRKSGLAESNARMQ